MIKTIFNLPADDVDRVSGLDDVTVYSTQQGTIAPIINHKEGLCANQWFRQAVSYALDYEEVMTATYGANGFTVGACYMDEAQPFWYTDAGSEEYNVHDPEKAKEILKEHGYDGTPLRLTAATLNKMDYMAVTMQSVGAGRSRHPGGTEYRRLADTPGAEHRSDSI